MIKAIIDISIRHRAIVLIMTALLTVWGAWALIETPKDAIPDLSDTQVIIYSTWKGRDPQTIEDQVTNRITRKLIGVPRTKIVRGFSFYNYSLIYVIFEDGTDIYWARSRILEYLSGMQLPEGVATSLGPDATGVGWIYQYTLEDTTGKYDLGELRALHDWYVKYQLNTVKNVSEVATIGGFPRQYQVIVDPNKLFSLNISLETVMEAIREGNNDVGGATIEFSEKEHMVRGKGYIKSTKDIEEIVVKVDASGVPVLVRDISKAVVIGAEMRRGVTDKDGRGQAVGGIVVMRFGQNALTVIDDVKAKLKEIEQGLPKGVVIKPVYDRSALIVRGIRTLSEQLTEILGMMAAVSIVFLFHFQSAIVSWIALPIGTLLAFIVMYYVGVNANIMSLGGIAIAMGDMADGAISLVENLHKKLEKNDGKRGHWEIVAEAAKEIGPGIFGSLLVLVVSFLPIFALTEQSGRLFKPLAYTKTFAMAAGAIITITLIPILMGYFIRGKITPEHKNPVNRAMIGGYTPLLRFVLHHRALSLIVAMLGLLSIVIPWSRIGWEFMPPLDEGDILYMPTTLPGISVTEAQQVLQNQDKILRAFPEVAVVFGKMGRAETATDPAPLEMVETTISLRPRDAWPKRLVVEGYLEGLAEDLVEANGARFSPAQTPEALRQIARETGSMARHAINGAIRLRLAGGETMAAVTPTLPDTIRKELTAALRETLKGRKITVPIADTPAIDVGNVPLRAVRGTHELMYDEMDPAMKFPSLVNAWTMPIKTRIDMLSTGIKTPVGIKVFGPDLAKLEELAVKVEEIVKRDPGTLSAIAQRVMQGYYLNFDIHRDACARYGLSVGEVQKVIETAIGGMDITTTVEGLYRFTVNIRYPRELRDNVDDLRKILVFAPTGQHIPLGTLADIRIDQGPPSIQSENGMMEAIVYVDLKQGQDVGTYVERVRETVNTEIRDRLPAGYYLSWSGEYEYIEAMWKRMWVVLPMTLVLVVLIVYFTVGRLLMTIILLITLPFALIGGLWYIHIMDFDMSWAVTSGFIVLAGFASQTALIMHVYLDLAMEEKIKSGVPITKRAIEEAMIEGAALRVRPKMMSVCTSIFGLLPLLWATSAEGGPLLRMAVPLMGGLITSVIHTLLLIPLYYAIYLEFKYRVHKVSLNDDSGTEQ